VSVDVQLPAAAREASVLDAANHVLPSQVLSKDAGTSTFHLLVAVRNVPSVGYQILHVVPGRQAFPSDLRVQGLTLENAALRVVVDSKNGCITSLYNRRARFETLAAGSCGNELQAFNDLPKRYDAWNIDPGTLDQIPQRLTQVDSVETVEKGPLRGIIRVTRTWQHSKFVQDIVLYAGSDQVYVINDIDWHETHVLLKAAFTLSAAGPFATYEIPFGTIERPTTRNNSWEKARFEVPAQNWADLGDAQHGFSLINDSKYGYDAAGNVLRLTLLRSPVWPDPNADRGSQHFTYVLYPHGGSWKQALTVRHGYEVNFPLTAKQVEQHTGTMPNQRAFLSVEPENVVLAAIKKAEDSNALILHLYEWAGKSASVEIVVPPGATNAAETNLIEQRQGSSLPIHGNHIVVPIRPYQIVAIRIDYQKHD
jgi:alpha-mannosidase